MSMLDEVGEQPEVAERLLRRAPEVLHPLARAVRERGVAYVIVAARGSSDHAAIYAQYVLGVRNRLTVALAAPSILSIYGATVDMHQALVVGISQSGASPDVVGVLTEARRQGAVTLALTNEPASPLGSAAEHVLELRAGPERSVAATKTYTAELLGVALLSAALRGEGDGGSELGRVPSGLAEALGVAEEAERLARATARESRCVVIGRGFEYATAREWALKLKELAGVVAEPHSSSDFEHGPKALVTPGFPVLVVAPLGAASGELRALVGRVTSEQGGQVLAITNDQAVRAAADASLVVPDGIAEWLMPLVTIVPAQLYTYHLTIASGRDPERPAHLSKVTLTH